MRFLGELEKKLEEEVKLRHQYATSISTKTLDIETDKTEIAQAERIAELVAGRAERLKVEEKTPPRVKQVDEPYVTQEEPQKRQVKAAGAASARGAGPVNWTLNSPASRASTPSRAVLVRDIR